MRILIVRNYPTTLDPADRCYNIQEIGLARALRKKGHACDVVFWCARSGRHVEIPCENGPMQVFYIRAARVLKCGVFSRELDALAERYDVVQLSEYHQIQSFLYARRFQEKAVILHGPYASAFTWRYYLLCRAADRLFLGRYRRLGTHFMVKSDRAAGFLRAKGIAQERIDRVYVGLDEQAFERTKEEAALPPALCRALAEEGPVLLYVGAIEPRRKSLFLLDTLSAVRGVLPGARLIVVGQAKGIYGRKWAAHMRRAGLNGAVTWLPRLRQPQLPALYRRADAFLFPTEFDIFGMVLLEAMYFGAPVVASPCAGTDTLIRDGENGFVPAQDTPVCWMERIVELASSPALRGRVIRAARERICAGFTWDVICERYLRSYRKKTGGEGSRA